MTLRAQAPSSLKRTAVYGCATLAICFWLVFIALNVSYGATRPRTPDEIAGRTIALYSHGSVAYLNRSEQELLWTLESAAGALAVAAFVLKRFWKVRTDPLEGFPKNIRDTVCREPRKDYDAIRATYNRPTDGDKGA